MSEVSIKFLMHMKVASTGKEGPREEVGKVVEQISQSLKEKKVRTAGSAVGVFHGDPKALDSQKAHYEVCVPISGKIKGEGEVQAKELEKGAYACITHSGPVEKMQDTYNAILKWVEENGYRIVGPTHEVYHKGVLQAGNSPQDVLIEVQFPVRKG
jgi:effector-binding domain-containing protein